MLRKDYIKKKVAPKEGIGMFLAERVLKTWHEDFVDQDTQEIVSIERNEVLYDRDKKVDSKMAKDIEEYGITEICVTNTPGRAEELRTFCRLGHVKVTMKGITKTGVVICRAESIRQAMDLAADYTEGATEEVFGEHCSNFHITDVEILNDITFIGRTAADIKAEQEALEKDKDTPVKMPFKVLATYARAEEWIENTSNKDAWVKKRKFVAWAHDIKDARNIVTAWIKKDVETEVGDNKRETLVIVAATPFTVHTYLPASVCNEYIEHPELRLSTEAEE